MREVSCFSCYTNPPMQDQYIFIHDAILEVIMCGDTQINAGDFHKKIRKIVKSAQNSQLNEFENQFMVRHSSVIVFLAIARLLK